MALDKVKLSSSNIEYTKTINDNFSDLETRKVDAVTGKGLSTNDYTTAEKDKLAGIAAGAQVNSIESVKVNGTALTPDGNKAVNIEALTAENLANDTTFKAVADKVDGIEAGAQVNVIESVKVNGVAQSITGKGIDISVPTNTDIDGRIDTKLADYTDTTTLNGLLADKVDKVAGKQLSTEDYTSAEKTKLGGIETGAQVNIVETVKVNGTALTPDANKAVNVVIPAAVEYSLVKQAEAESGYAHTYYLTKDGVQEGAKINIPKDLVVESGELKTVTTADQPYEGAQVGDKYIDLVIANAASNHIYIPVKDLVDIYTAGNGIDVTNNSIAIKIDTANANGLSTTSTGLKLATATTTTAGAMSAADKTKLEGIATGAQVNVVESVKVNGVALTPDANKAVDVTVPTKISDLTNDDNTVKDASYVHTDNNYTTAEKNKLAGIEASADVNIIEQVKVNGTALTPDSNKAVDVSVPTRIFSKVKVGNVNVEAKSATDTIELVAGNNITLTPDAANGKVTVTAVVPDAIESATFTDNDERWSGPDSDGNYTLTIANTGVALSVKKVAIGGGYQSCMADLSHDGTNIKVVADAKFAGVVYYFG